MNNPAPFGPRKHLPTQPHGARSIRLPQERARKLRDPGNDAPILLASGYARLLNAADLERIGDCAFLSKPFSLEALLKTVRDLLA